MEKQHPYMSPLYVFVQLYFSSLLRSLRHKLWWKYILFLFRYYIHYIVITFSFLYHCVHYAVIKTKNIFLVNNKINFGAMFTTPGSWKKSFFLFHCYCYYVHYSVILTKKYYFDFHHLYFSTTSTSSTTFTYVIIKRILLFISLLRSLRHVLFHYGNTFNTPWSQKNKFDFYWNTTLTTLRSWKKCSFFISLGRWLWKHLLTWSYIYLLRLTSLTCLKKFPNDILPGKKHVSLKKLSSLGISVESSKFISRMLKILNLNSGSTEMSEKKQK